jgi:hypothetical protein
VTVDSPEDLYGLPLERFIAERTALVKALRGRERRNEASEVAALRKPSVAAWAVNQLVRTQPQALQALFSAGDDLERVGETLRAAAVDVQARREVAAGCLTQELRSVGVGFAGSAPAPAPVTSEQRAALKAARRSQAQARRAATRAEKELAAAQARRAKAAASLQEAEGLLSAAAQRAEQAGAKLATVEQSVSDLAETE